MSPTDEKKVVARARRFAGAYRVVAVIGLNTLLLLLLLEALTRAGLAVSHRFSAPAPTVEGPRLPAYWAAAPRGREFWAEHSKAEREIVYDPFVLWRTREFVGEWVNVDAGGRRSTGSPVGCAATVFVLGGSAVWGWGVPDSATIPSRLAARLAELGLPACVRNLGENAFVSSQEVIRLENALRAGQVPDVVVVYDGYNDMIEAWQTGRPGIHYDLDRIAAKLEDRPVAKPALIDRVAGHSKLVAVLRRLARPAPAPQWVRPAAVARGDSLAGETVAAWEANLEMVRGLAAAFDFRAVFVWQPHVFAGHRALTENERPFADAPDLAPARAFIARVDSMAAARAATLPDVHWFGDVFDDAPGDAWIDAVHGTPEGNDVAARRLARILADLPALRTGR